MPGACECSYLSILLPTPDGGSGFHVFKNCEELAKAITNLEAICSCLFREDFPSFAQLFKEYGH